MEEIKLDVQTRSETGSRKIKAIRKQAFVPAVVYGLDKEPALVKVDKRGYEKITRQYRGQSVVFHINVIKGDKKITDYSAIVKEEQHNPVSEELMHIDFKRISLTEEIEVTAPLEAKGEPIGIKTAGGGSVEHLLWELDIICLPTNIPAKIQFDISALNIGDSIYVKDIVLPQGVKTKHDPEAIVVTVVPPMREVKEPVAEEGAVVVEPEVIKEKKVKEEPAE